MEAHRANVLAVDDNEANLIALESVLSREYNLINASSGAEALAVLDKRKDVDMILLDIQMPGMDGFETAIRIKKISGCEDIPIIFITAIHREDPSVKRGYEVGAVDYFSKPYDPDILRMKVGIYAAFRRKGEVLKERERQLRASEELLAAGRDLSALLDAQSAGVLVVDARGRICQTNLDVARVYGSADAAHPYGQLVGWWDASGELITCEDGPVQRALQGHKSLVEGLRIESFDGTSRTMAASASPLRGPNGEVVGAVVLMHDVTAAEEIEVRIKRLLALGGALQLPDKRASRAV